MEILDYTNNSLNNNNNFFQETNKTFSSSEMVKEIF